MCVKRQYVPYRISEAQILPRKGPPPQKAENFGKHDIHGENMNKIPLDEIMQKGHADRRGERVPRTATHANLQQRTQTEQKKTSRRYTCKQNFMKMTRKQKTE